MTLNDLSARLVQVLLEKKLEIAQAESCTGGLFSKCITDQPGSSTVFQCGVVSYSGNIKHQLLGVSLETLQAYGEVSKQTALEMADGIRKLASSDIGVGITGIAGPGGGSKEKPVGLVYFAVSYQNTCKAVRLELYDLKSRKEIREKTVCSVIEYLLTVLN